MRRPPRIPTFVCRRVYPERGQAYLKMHWNLASQCAPSLRLVEATARSTMNRLIMNGCCVGGYTEMKWNGGASSGLLNGGYGNSYLTTLVA